MDFLFNYERALILQDAHDIFRTGPSVAVTYRRYTGSSFTPATGAYTPSYTDTVTSAIRNAIPAREVQASDGLFRQGDLRFIVERAAITGEPTKDDRLLDGTRVYDLIDWDSDPMEALWRIAAREVA